jgi:hypothetical protein
MQYLPAANSIVAINFPRTFSRIQELSKGQYQFRAKESKSGARSRHAPAVESRQMTFPPVHDRGAARRAVPPANRPEFVAINIAAQ